jgi:hypothetical protein
MKITAGLNEKIVKAVRISMQIEGYKPAQSQETKQRAKTLMEQQRFQVISSWQVKFICQALIFPEIVWGLKTAIYYMK